MPYRQVRLDTERRYRAGLSWIANETADRMTIHNQGGSDRATDEAVRASEEDTHVFTLSSPQVRSHAALPLGRRSQDGLTGLSLAKGIRKGYDGGHRPKASKECRLSRHVHIVWEDTHG
jgi:hypothetical protein